MSFTPSTLLRGEFIERPNRFVVIARVEGRGRVRAVLPNPGRLRELFLPGAILYLSDDQIDKEAAGAESREGKHLPTRRTRYTVWAVERDGQPVFLHTSKTNDVTRFLMQQGRIPGLEEARIARAEVTHGSSRFDFLLQEQGHPVFMEVKSVTLFGNGAAMFPDAVTDRSRRHLLELAEIGDAAAAIGAPRPIVLFLVHSGRVDRFLPDYHTDLAFARTLVDVRDRVRILPVSVSWSPTLRPSRAVRRLEIPWDFVDREAQDRGAYLLLLHLKENRRIEEGRLGAFEFSHGWHVYVGSAMKDLSARVARHLRRRKRFHWHIDWLRDAADVCEALPIRSSRREECEIANVLGQILTPGPPGFGCSDCACDTHLFTSNVHPLHRRDFHILLQRFRMPRLNQ